MAPCHDNILLVVAWFRHIGSMGEKVGLKIISGFSFIILKKMLKNTNCCRGALSTSPTSSFLLSAQHASTVILCAHVRERTEGGRAPAVETEGKGAGEESAPAADPRQGGVAVRRRIPPGGREFPRPWGGGAWPAAAAVADRPRPGGVEAAWRTAWSGGETGADPPKEAGATEPARRQRIPPREKQEEGGQGPLAAADTRVSSSRSVAARRRLRQIRSIYLDT